MRALIQTQTEFRYRGTFGDDHVFSRKTEYSDDDAINTVVDAELAEATDDANTVAMAMETVARNGDDAVYEHVNLGDAVEVADIDAVRANQRTVSIAVRESNLGVVRTGLSVNSKLDDDLSRQRRALDLVTPGTLSGRADPVSTNTLGAGVTFAKLPTRELSTYQQTGYLVAELVAGDPNDPGRSDDWPVDEPILMYRVRFALAQAGSTDTIVHLRKNGTGPYSRTTAGVLSRFFHEIIIPAGEVLPDDDTNVGQYTNFTATKGDVIHAATHQAGNFARGLVVRVKYTSQT